MFGQFYRNFLVVAHSASHNRLFRFLFIPFYRFYRKLKVYKRNKQFKMHGFEALSRFDECLNQNGFFYTLAFGTLLGAIREHGFIKHDVDIDVCMYAEDYDDSLPFLLEQYGIKLEHEFLVDNGDRAREQTYSYKNVGIDVFYIYPPIGTYPYCCDFLVKGDSISFSESMSRYGGLLTRRIEMPFKKERCLVQFETNKFYVPSNSDELLVFRYGPDYMIPNPNWGIHGHDDHIIEWKEVRAIYKEY